MKVLFICAHNRFRSKVAEAIAKKLDTRRGNEYKSAGIRLDLIRPYICENVKKVMKKKGYEISDERAREINDLDLKWAEIIVIVADNVDKNIFKGNTRAKIEKWEISDADEGEFLKIRKIIDEIEDRIVQLLKSLD